MPKNLTNKIYKNMKTGSFVNSHFFCFFVFCHKEYENKGETQLYDSFDFFFRTQIFICMQIGIQIKSYENCNHTTLPVVQEIFIIHMAM